MVTRSTGDIYVENVQKWVNEKFSGEDGYTPIEENGYTGWNTIYALLHALQITLEVGSTANNFGTGTINAFNNFINAHGNIQERTPEQDSELRGQLLIEGADVNAISKLIDQYEKIHGIIQGALLCKGYAIGANAPTGNFYGGTANAIRSLKEDAGLTDSSSVVTLNIMKALLSMDYFYSYDNSERTQNIIEMQRYLNRNYENYIGLKPCDGIYGRGTNQAMIYAVQAEEGLPVGTANGNCGPTTKNCLPTLSASGTSSGTNYNGNAYTTTSISNFKRLANIALYFNGYGDGSITDSLNESVIKNFQAKYSVSQTGKIDYTTWLALLISCGDINRSAVACDCATIITEENVEVLTANDYQYIGRYISGTIWDATNEQYVSKALSEEELNILFENNIRVFPIHQGAANYADYFTTERAMLDAESANTYANSLKLQFGAIIYFAVDYDATDYEITNKVLPYFRQLYATFMDKCKGKYRVGVYGTRNLCTRICTAGYACSSFVSDMSTGFSGNLGFPIPENWALDQFHTTTISHNGKSIEIDKDGFSGKYRGIGHIYNIPTTNSGEIDTIGNTFILVNRSGVNLPVYESREWYNHPTAVNGSYYVTAGNKIGDIKPNEFYIFFGISNLGINHVHKVLFFDGEDVRIGYVEGSQVHPGNTDTNTNQGNYNQRPQYHEPYSCLRYLPDTDDYMLVSASQDQEITINKPVVYYTTNGVYEGTLEKGDKIIISSGNVNNTGGSRPWCYRVTRIIKKDGQIINSNKYVSVGLEYGSSGAERAWY